MTLFMRDNGSGCYAGIFFIFYLIFFYMPLRVALNFTTMIELDETVYRSPLLLAADFCKPFCYV